MRVGILGAGTWGIALAKTLCDNKHNILVWSPIEEEILQLSFNRKQKNLPDTVIPDNISFTNDIEKTCSNKDAIIIAVPSIFVRDTIKRISSIIDDKVIIITVAKGIEKDTYFTMSEIIEDELAKVNKNNPVVALSGPTHAEEVAIGLPSTIVSACKDISVAEEIQELFNGTCLRVYTNTDIKGVEVCGALKNIIALAVGISKGLGYGDNTKAALITRGLAEMERLGEKLGCLTETFHGLAGMGDLIVTATSEHSRNNKCGYLIGKGVEVQEAIDKVGMVVEGINAIPAAIALAEKYDVDMPITFTVNNIINGKETPNEAVGNLMGRTLKMELSKAPLDINYERAIISNINSRKDEGLGMKRVITYGTFDLLHYGHINLLKRAKALGDYLIVALSTDEFNWNEKSKKCYFTYEQRKGLLEAIRYVDLVIPEESWEQKKKDIHEYHIDTFVIGDDWEGKFDFLKDEGAEVVYLSRTPEISSSQIKNDLNNSDSKEETKTSHDDINTNPQD